MKYNPRLNSRLVWIVSQCASLCARENFASPSNSQGVERRIDRITHGYHHSPASAGAQEKYRPSWSALSHPRQSARSSIRFCPGQIPPPPPWSTTQSRISSQQRARHVSALASQMNEDGPLKLTNPTHSACSRRNPQDSDILHAKRRLLYMMAQHDALVAKRARRFWRRPHALNLHKTFSTPHGAVPGFCPVACKAVLERFCRAS